MKKLLLAFTMVLALAGCAQLPAKKEIVYVDKPIPFVPKPPDVPGFESEVDKLTIADVKDPGKVGQAYKYDMTQLRALNKIYQMVLEQYRASSQNFDQVNTEIDQLINKINGADASK